METYEVIKIGAQWREWPNRMSGNVKYADKREMAMQAS